MQKENRNNRVHTGEQSGKTDFLIEGLLPVGKENAVTTRDQRENFSNVLPMNGNRVQLFVPDPAGVTGGRRTGRRYRNLYIQ